MGILKTDLMIAVVFALFITGVLTSSSYAEIDPESIVGVWFLDEGKGDIVEDHSGNGHDGIIKGAANWVEGNFRDALEFPEGSLVSVPHADSLNLATWTLIALVKVEGITGQWQVIAGKYDLANAVNHAIYARLNEGTTYVQFSSGNVDCGLRGIR